MKSLRFTGRCARPAIMAPDSRLRAALAFCKTFATGPAKWCNLANETGPEEQLIGVANELDLAAGDGWAMIAPYGSWPHAEGMQVFDRKDAGMIVDRFKSVWGRIKRAVVGLPLYKGHPDHVAFANIHKDKTEYGQWADLEARSDGLWGRPVLSSAGADLVQGGLRWLSPNWRAAMVGLANGRPVYRPRILDSVGLTDRPNIPGPSLTNSLPETVAPSPETLNSKPETLVDLQKLITLLALANTATEADVVACLTALASRPAPEALANEATARTTAESRVAALTADLATAQASLANERTAHATAATARNAALIDGAVRAGRITEAARAIWEARLGRDFATESVALANEQSGPKTAGRTDALGARKPACAASTKFTSLVNERVAKGQTFDAAWASVKATAEGKALLAQMQPATAA